MRWTRRRNAWYVLAVAATAQAGLSIIDQGIPTLAGFIKHDLHLSAATVGLAVSAFPLGKIFGAYAAGRAADRRGERPVLLAGGLLTGTVVVAASAAPAALLFVLIGLAGVAASAGTPAGGRLIMSTFPVDQRGLALGLRQTAVPVGGLLAAVALPWIAHAASWRIACAVAGAAAVTSVVPLTSVQFAERPPKQREETPPDSRSTRNVMLLTIWGCLLVSGQPAVMVFLALDLRQRTGISLAAAGLFVAAANAAGIVGRIGWATASDRSANGRRPLLLIVNLVAVAAALALWLLPADAPLAAYAAAAALAGLSVIGFQGLWVTILAEAAGYARAGAATGLAVTFGTATIAAVPPLLGAFADLTGSYRVVWAALALLVTLGLAPALLLQQHQTPDPLPSRDVV